MDFLWPAFSRIRKESEILTLYGKMQVKEDPYSSIIYAAKCINPLMHFDKKWSKTLLKFKTLFNDIHMEELVFYWIQYKNSLK